MRKAQWLRRYSFLLLFLCSPALAQSPELEDEVAPSDADAVCDLEHAVPVDSRPNEPLRIFSHRLPFKIAPMKEKNQFSADYHMTNSWNPSIAVSFPKYPGQYKIYTADGVIRGLTLRFAHQINENAEWGAALSTFMLVGGQGAIDAPVSDGFIEWTHVNLFGQHDPFQRLKNPLNAAHVKMVDRQGRQYSMKPGTPHFGTFDVNYTRFKNLRSTPNHIMTGSAIAGVGLPLNGLNHHASVTLGASAASTWRINDHNSVTVGLQVRGQDHGLVRVRRKEKVDIDFDERRLAAGYRFIVADNIDFANGGRLTCAIELQGDSAPIKRGGEGPVELEEVGQHSPYYSAPYNKVTNPRTNQEKAADAMLRGSEYIGLKFSYRPWKAGQSPTFSTGFREDWSMFTGKRFMSLFEESNNQADFSVFAKAAFPMGKIKVRRKK